jgi:AraC-like DNA-binding protein
LPDGFLGVRFPEPTPKRPVPGQTWQFVADSPGDSETLARPLEAHYAQSGPGRFQQRVQGVFLDHALVVADHLATPVHFRGSVIPDSIAFQCFRSNAPVRNGRLSLSEHHLAIGVPGDPLDITSQAEGESLSVFVNKAYWHQSIRKLSEDPPPDFGGALVAFRCSEARMQRFARRVRWVLEAASSYPECFKRPEIRRFAELGLVCTVLELMEQRRQRIEYPATETRGWEAVARAEAHVRDHFCDPLTLLDLCEIAGLKTRALQYAFQEKHGLTPMAYLKMTRLNRARRLLRNADPRNVSVTAIAMQVGFWHLSQFACDYRWLFHELPSETLRRGKPIESR